MPKGLFRLGAINPPRAHPSLVSGTVVAGALVAGALGVGLAGCSTFGAATTQQPSVTTNAGRSNPNTSTSVSPGGSAANQPLDDTSDSSLTSTLRNKALTVGEVARQAVTAVTSECMAEAGFDYSSPTQKPISVPPPRPWRPQTTDSWLHVADNLAVSDTDPPPATTPEYSQKLWGNPIATWEADTENTIAFTGQALSGDVYDGCLPSAQVEIIGGGEPKYSFRVDDVLSMIQDVERQTFAALAVDPEFAEATEAWEACMKNNGYQIYQGELATFSPAEPLPATQEQAAVTRYNECLANANLTEIGDRLYPTYRQQTETRLLGDGRQIEADLDAIAQRSNDALSN